MAQFLVLNNDKTARLKGDIVELRATGHPLSDTEKLDFIVVVVPSLTIREMKLYYKEWIRNIGYSIVTHQNNTDNYRVKITGISISQTSQGVNFGKISVEQVENYLSGWNVVLHNFADNEVTINIGTYETAISPKFWDRDSLSAVVFSHISYEPSTGIHVIQADYSSKNWGHTAVENAIDAINNDTIVLAHEGKILTYQVQGTGVPKVHSKNVPLKKFWQDLQEKVQQTLKSSRYHFTSAFVDSAVNNTIVLTETELLSNIKDKLLE